MALNAATIKATIDAEMLITYGTPADPVEQQKFTEAMAQAILKILTAQSVVVMAGNGIDTGGDSLVTNQGNIT